MSKSELSLEKLRKRSPEELSEIYSISKNFAVDLRTSLQPEYFSILTNPDLTFLEMAEKLGVSYLTVVHYRRALTKARLEKYRRRRIIKDAPKRALSFLENKPSTYDDIIKNTGASHGTVRKLKSEGKIRSVRMVLGRRGCKHTFHSDQLIDGLTARVILYLPGEEILLGRKVTEYLPKELTRGMRKSLTHRLKSILPKEAFEVVYEYMCEHAVL